MRVLITGGTGFVGKTLVSFLVEKGFVDICLLIRNKEKANDIFNNLPIKYINTTFENWQDNIINYNPDVVLHMATFFNSASHNEIAEKIIESNITFTIQLLEAVSKTECQYFINIGTFSEFLFGDGNYNPNNLYSASKSAVRHFIKYYQLLSKWKWINVILYSPYGRKNEQKKVIDYMIEALDAPLPIKFSKGEQILDFIHVDDISDFFFTLLSKIKLFKEPFTQFYLGTGTGHSLRKLGSTLEELTGKKINAEWGAYPYQTLEIMHAVAPISKNIKYLNWKASIDLKKGLEILLRDINYLV